MRKTSLALAALVAAGLASTGASADAVSTAKLDVTVAPATMASGGGFSFGGLGALSGPAMVGVGFAAASVVTMTAVTSGGDLGGVCPVACNEVPPAVTPPGAGATHNPTHVGTSHH